MSKIKILLLFSILGMAACSNQDDENCTPNLITYNYLPANDSSWWAYAIYTVDTNGIRNLFARDTLRTLEETTLNGQTYMEYYGSLWLYTSPVSTFLMRDSANHLVYGDGTIVLPYLNFTDSFNRTYENGALVSFSQLIADTEPTTVPAGTFTTVDFRGSRFRQPTPFCADSIGYHPNQFAENVGLVRATYWYFSTGGCSYIERVLESYHIQ